MTERRIAIAALVISVISLAIHFLHGKTDAERSEEARVRNDADIALRAANYNEDEIAQLRSRIIVLEESMTRPQRHR